MLVNWRLEGRGIFHYAELVQEMMCNAYKLQKHLIFITQILIINSSLLTEQQANHGETSSCQNQ